MTDIRIGIVGAGGIAKKHLEALRTVGGARISAVVDRSAEHAAWLTDETGARYCAGVDDLIEHVDAVMVLTPPRARIDPISALIAAGVPIFCEKPLAATVDDAERIAEIVESGPRAPFMMGFMRRWHPPHAALREVLASGELGTLVQVVRQRIGRIDLPEGNWRRSPGQLCGVTMESASHDIDLLRWLHGDIVAASGEVVQSRPELPGFDETMAATVRFASGLTGSLQVSWQSRLARNAIGIIGTEGAAILEGPGLWSSRTLTVATAEGERSHEFRAHERDDDGYVGQARAFLELARGGEPEHPSIADGLATVRVSQAILDSSH